MNRAGCLDGRLLGGAKRMHELNKKNEEKIDSKNGRGFINLIPWNDWIIALLVTSPLITSNQLGGFVELFLQRFLLSAHC